MFRWRDCNERTGARKMKITFGDMAEALNDIRKEEGLFSNPIELKILERAKLNKKEQEQEE
jgi:hypothetical protein